MIAPPWDPVVALGIGGLAALVAIFAPLIVANGDGGRALRWFVGFLLLMGGSAAAASSGWLSRFDLQPPPMVIMIAAVLLGSLALGLSRIGARLAQTVPLLTLIGLQSFRLPLELAMHRAAERGIMPVELSYSGYNFDIITGAAAAALYIVGVLRRDLPRSWVWAWNVWGILCLVVIVVIAVSTSPMVRAFGDDPAHINTWVLFVPYVWLPVIMVSTAIVGHIVLTRHLLSYDEATPGH